MVASVVWCNISHVTPGVNPVFLFLHVARSRPSAIVVVWSHNLRGFAVTEPKKKKAGRPKKKAAEKRRQATTSLTPDLYRVAVSLGGGSVYRGLQVAVERAAGVRE